MNKLIFWSVLIILAGSTMYLFGANEYAISKFLLLGTGFWTVIGVSAIYVTSFGILGSFAGGGSGLVLGVSVSAIFLLGLIVGRFVIGC